MKPMEWQTSSAKLCSDATILNFWINHQESLHKQWTGRLADTPKLLQMFLVAEKGNGVNLGHLSLAGNNAIEHIISLKTDIGFQL